MDILHFKPHMEFHHIYICLSQEELGIGQQLAINVAMTTLSVLTFFGSLKWNPYIGRIPAC